MVEYRLFEMRELVGIRLKDLIRDFGYTKVSLCKKSGLSRPTLDKLLAGKVDSKSRFDHHLAKIMTALHISAEDLLSHAPVMRSPQVIYSANAPDDHEMSSEAKVQFELLQDLIDLCDIYY